jgi:hypothetical protein
MRSQPILPIRFYSDRHDQDRFNLFHRKPCESLLNYPPNELPQFQITRPQSLAEPQYFLLKNVCNDQEGMDGKVIPEQASNMGEPGFTNFFGPITAGYTYDNGVDPPEGRADGVFAIPDCGKLVNTAIEYATAVAPFPKLTIPTVLTNIYKLKIIVDKLNPTSGSSFHLNIYNGATNLGKITAPGIYIYEFTSTGANTDIILQDIVSEDEFQISYVQCVLEAINALYITDVQLDENDLQVHTTKDQTDIIIFCNNTVNNNVSPGQYYYLIQFDDGTYLYSEVFNIKSYKEIEKHYRLSWWHNTDLNGQIYYNADWIGCEYRNFLYLDASLFEPEYETTVDSVKNGENEDVSVFKKWQKSIKLQIVRAPEFLADALSGIFLHDNIFLRNPLNRLQEFQQEEYEVLKPVSEISAVLDDAYQRVELKLILSENYTNTNCEESVDPFTCEGVYTYKVAVSSANAPYYLVTTGPPAAGDGLYRHSDNVQIFPDSDEYIFDFDNNRYYKLEEVSDIWQIVDTYPTIVSANVVGGNFDVVGIALPLTFVKIQYNYNGGGWVDYVTGETDENGDFTISIPTSLSTGATDFDIRFMNISRECVFSTSALLDVV